MFKITDHFSSAENHSFGAKVKEVASTFAYIWLWVVLVSLVLRLIANAASITVPDQGQIIGVFPNLMLWDKHVSLKQAIASGLGWELIAACVVAPFLEEVIFRNLICGLASNREGSLRHNRWAFTLVLTGSFIAFGWAHMNGYYSVLIQGVTGLFLARLWFRNGPNQKASYFSCVTAHGLYNFSVIVTVWLNAS